MNRDEDKRKRRPVKKRMQTNETQQAKEKQTETTTLKYTIQYIYINKSYAFVTTQYITNE